jgi:CRP/FNR family transcriptional regulator, anaerobic regulatory protein
MLRANSLFKCTCDRGCPLRLCLNPRSGGFGMPMMQKHNFSVGDNVARDFLGSMGANMVVSGVLKVFDVTVNGDQLIRRFVFPGEFIEIYPWQVSPTSNVVALTDARICNVNFQWDEQDEMIPSDVTRVLLAAAFDEARRADFWQELILSRRPIDRLIRFLVDVAERFAQPKERYYIIELPMSRADIADYLGLQRETISRCFSQLRGTGLLLTLNRHTSVITNMEHFRGLLETMDYNASSPGPSRSRDSPPLLS